MPDAMYQHPFFFDIIEVLRAYFAAQEDTLVDGDFPLYYLDADGKRQYVKPDCGVAFGVNPDYIYARNGYFLGRGRQDAELRSGDCLDDDKPTTIRDASADCTSG